MRFVFAAIERFFLSDETFDVEVTEGFIHCDHSHIFTGLHDAGEHEGFTVTDGRGDGGGVYEQLKSESTAGAICSWHELLRNDASERL